MSKVYNCTYHEWSSSMDGPCCAWSGAGCSARGLCKGADGREYAVEYRRESLCGVAYSVSLDDRELESYSSLREATKSEFISAFRAVRDFAMAKRKACGRAEK